MDCGCPRCATQCEGEALALARLDETTLLSFKDADFSAVGKVVAGTNRLSGAINEIKQVSGASFQGAGSLRPQVRLDI